MELLDSTKELVATDGKKPIRDVVQFYKLNEYN